jgi:sugar O-acyltransferase (sialic acid O-acetyltransferase NeuD family)
MSLQKAVIIGAGGFGREILDVFDAINAIKPTFDVIGFIVEPEYGKSGTFINDKPILGGFDWFAEHKNEVQAICGVGAPELRMRFVGRAQEMGVHFCSVVHPHAILTRRVRTGQGTVITAGCILTNRIRIGSHVHINLGCTIGHDVVIEDFVTLAPGVHVSGKVKFGEGSYIGTGTNIIEKRIIGAWSIVGAGSTVIRDVPKNTTVVGVPGKVMKSREYGWHLK